MDPSTVNPFPEPSPRTIDNVFVKPLSNQPVIRERLKLGGPMTAAPFRWQQPIEVDLVGGAALSFAHDRRKRPSRVFPCLLDL